MPAVRYGTPAARWVLAAAVLGSGIAFLDGTVVNVALPAIGRDFHASLAGLQWTLDAYLITLSALLLLGGSLGDRYGRRRMFVVGLGGFTVASLLCGLAPSAGALVAARGLQGVGGALLVPGSLSIISSVFHPDDRGRAIGAWSGLAGIASALGPFLGGWLIGAVSWRLIFLINVPLAAVAIWIAVRHVPETRSADEEHTRLDIPGALTVTLALVAISYAAIERNGAESIVAAVAGAVLLATFLVLERVRPAPMLPLGMFGSRQFSGTNLTTFAVYAGLGGALFLVVLRLQTSLGYSALEAGAALVPFTALMLVVSPRAGQLGQRIGPRIPMTVGPLVAAGGLALFARIEPGRSYVSAVLPAVVVFGLGMALTVAPLTAAVLASVEEGHSGIASGVNNAVARLSGLLAVAVLPALAGIATDESVAASLDTGFSKGLLISAGVCAAGGIVAFVLVRDAARVRTPAHPAVTHACQDPCIEIHGAPALTADGR